MTERCGGAEDAAPSAGQPARAETLAREFITALYNSTTEFMIIQPHRGSPPVKRARADFPLHAQTTYHQTCSSCPACHTARALVPLPAVCLLLLAFPPPHMHPSLHCVGFKRTFLLPLPPTPPPYYYPSVVAGAATAAMGAGAEVLKTSSPPAGEPEMAPERTESACPALVTGTAWGACHAPLAMGAPYCAMCAWCT